MAGGPGSTDLVIAAGRAGGMGFVAGGYQPAEAFAAEIATVAARRGAVRRQPVRAQPGAGRPGRLPVLRRRAGTGGGPLRGAAAGLAVSDDDDDWRAKVDVLRERPVPLVSFTFGLPPAADLALLRSTGAVLAQTVTSVAEARAAASAGVDVLIVQAAAAGGHSGTFTPARPVPVVPLAALVAVDPVRGAAAGGRGRWGRHRRGRRRGAGRRGGAGRGGHGVAARRARRAPSATHRAALADPARTATVVTRAFTGRPARGLRNDFTDRYSPAAPPAIRRCTT